ncbi:MAG TPA: hypothetical protein VGM78_01045 [Ilumatobacteraceae bacterium]
MKTSRRAPLLGGLLALLAALTLFAAACTSSSSKGPAVVNEADVYVAAIQWYVGTKAATVNTDPDPLVLYVAPATGKEIDVGAQATVLGKLASDKDHLTIRFADSRDDAINSSDVAEAVKDDGVLLAVGGFDAGSPSVALRINVYRDKADSTSYEIHVAETAGTIAVTSSSELAAN